MSLNAANALSLAALCVANSALANPPDDPEIVVIAPETGAERRTQLRDMAKDVLRKPRRDLPIARFFYPVCPRVLGLAADDAAAIEARVRENAEALGIGANEAPECKPTITIAFMSEKAGPAGTWLSEDSPQLAHLVRIDRQRVLLESGPVRAWNKTAVRDFDGRPIQQDQGWTIVRSERVEGPVVTSEVTGAAVMIEKAAANGKTLMQLADYVTMRTLASTDPIKSGTTAPAATILSLFDQEAPPPGLTLFDRALVSSLYASSINSRPRRVYRDVAIEASERERKSGRNE